MAMQFWFDFASTYSYLAAMRIEALAAARGLAVDWRPFLLGPIFQAQGWGTSPFNLYPVKGRYMWRDMERQCAKYGLPFRRPTDFPRSGLLPARVACLGDGAAWLPAFVRAVYTANFVEDRDIADPAVVADALAAAGGPADRLGQASMPEAKAKLRANTDQAQALGLFGAPSFLVGEELFWGDDRLADAIAWAAGEPGAG
jgi:2-hydroxychromene-2-carboxylate isomerase